ncbi:MAG: DNA-processing protein DprA [Clostridia bacterium]|nr:DNA-processing protein DprA [Clostridia bacterium]
MQYTDIELAQIFLSSCPGMTPKKYKKFIEPFRDELDAVRHAKELPYSIFGKQEAVVREYLKDKSAFRNYLKLLDEKKIICLTRASQNYPHVLLDFDDAPIMLYAKGNVQRMNFSLQQSITIVGSRQPTRYGETVTKLFAGDLSASGVTIVSGLAIGVDACAHAAAIDAGGMTIGIVSGGVDCGIPTDNIDLAKRILDADGVILSEYAPGTPVRPWMFAQRNRILSGLTCGTLLVQAREKSGAMITVDHAQDQGKTVFCVPGEITQSASYWPNRLLREGAIPVLQAQDILDEFAWDGRVLGSTKKNSLDWTDRSDVEQKILLALSKGQLTVEKLCDMTNLSMQSLMSHLTSLEMEGIIKQFPGHIVDILDAYRP